MPLRTYLCLTFQLTFQVTHFSRQCQNIYPKKMFNFFSPGREMSLTNERVKRFAEKCAELGKTLGVDVVDLYTLFHAQPVRHSAVYINC